jgi:hypothetical protein
MMSRRFRSLALAAALLVAVGAVALLTTAGAEARGSSLARGADGWLAARRYLAARGARVRLLDRPLEELAPGGVLVETFPWQSGGSAEVADALERHLRRGGDLVLAYSGELRPGGETVVLEALGLSLRQVRKPTLVPWRWRDFAHRQWDLRPARGTSPMSATSAMSATVAPVRVWAPRWAPRLPREGAALYRSPLGQPVIAVLPRYRGRIVLLPADAFANARLENPGNADLLETLRRSLGDRWTFDEYHHGLISGAPEESAALGRTLDLVLVHLAVLYLVGVWTLSRRFGPAWSEPPRVTGSAGAFLLGLGALHHRLGHHAAAAGRLLARVRELDRLDGDGDLPAELDRRAAAAGPRELVALAREVARRRRHEAPETITTTDLQEGKNAA